MTSSSPDSDIPNILWIIAEDTSPALGCVGATLRELEDEGKLRDLDI